MRNQDLLVHDEMRKLIKKSCASLQTKESNSLYGFQKSLLKFFFKAADVAIEYETNTILLWTADSSGSIENNLYRLQDAVAVTISYANLEETLKGCLEKGVNQTRFYKSLLFHYNHVTRTVEPDAISA